MINLLRDIILVVIITTVFIGIPWYLWYLIFVYIPWVPLGVFLAILTYAVFKTIAQEVRYWRRRRKR